MREAMNSKRPGLSTPSPQLDVMGRIDEVYGDLSSKTVPRTVPPKWRGSLPYLSSMSPAPTYHNLSQAARSLAANWEPGVAAGSPRPEEFTRGSSDAAETSSEPSRASTPKTPNQGGDEMVDPLPLTLPAMTEQSGKNAGSKGSVVSVAALPAFFRNSPEPGETISADETFQAAEILGAGPRQEESTQPGMEWFNRTGLVRMQEHWERHASVMDSSGKAFVESFEALHAEMLRQIAQVKTFDLKTILSCMKQYTDSVRGMTLETYKVIRKEEDEFSNILYHTVRNHFEKGLQAALERCEERHRQKLKTMQDRHSQVLKQSRDAGNMDMNTKINLLKSNLTLQHQAELTSIRDEARRRLEEADALITQMKTQEELLHKELKSLRDEVKALMVDNRSLQGWRPRYEKEHAKLENLKREFTEDRRRNLEYINAMKAQQEGEIMKRDNKIRILQESVFHLEDEMMMLRPGTLAPMVRKTERLSMRDSIMGVVNSMRSPGNRFSTTSAVEDHHSHQSFGTSVHISSTPPPSLGKADRWTTVDADAAQQQLRPGTDPGGGARPPPSAVPGEDPYEGAPSKGRVVEVAQLESSVDELPSIHEAPEIAPLEAGGTGDGRRADSGGGAAAPHKHHHHHGRHRNGGGKSSPAKQRAGEAPLQKAGERRSHGSGATSPVVRVSTLSLPLGGR